MNSKRINKTSFFTIFLLMCTTLNAQQAWFPQLSGTNRQLNSVFFINTSSGWIAGSNGTILSTSNGGLNWASQISASQDSLFSVIFINQSLNGWACGSNGTIEFTSNGGSTWNLQHSGPANLTLYSMTYDGFTVYSSGIEHDVGPAFEKSTNSGTNWLEAIYGLSTLNVFYSLNAPSISSGWIVTGAGRIFHFLSTFGLISQLSGVSSPLYSVSFVNSSTGFTVGANGVILKTTDGSMWVAKPSQSSVSLRSVYFPNPSTGWTVGNSGTILKSTNGGSSWFSQASSLTGTLRSVFFANDSTGWAVGDSGKIISTLNQNISGIKSNTHQVATYYSLSQNYPNPFNPSTKISFAIPKASFIKLSIFDILGREVETLVNENRNAGSYEVSFDGSSFPSGIYFYELRAGDYVDVKKMILVK